MLMPSVILFVNGDLNDTLQNNLTRQLEINDTMSLAEFNARVAADPNYPAVVHLNNLRIMVILPTFQDTTNRNLADIVLFVKQGLASVEKSNFGPPGLTLDIQRLNIWNLINGIKGNNTACFPFPGFLPPPQTQTPENPRPHEHLRHGEIEGLGALERYGVEALERDDRDEGVFGDRLRPHRDEEDDDF